MFFALLAVLTASAFASPLSSAEAHLQTRDTPCTGGVEGPFLETNFPDPSLTNVDGTWFSFATWNGKDFRGAESKNFTDWKRFESGKLLAIEEATWANANRLWAPDVMRRAYDNKYVMYFTADDKQKTGSQCIGAAISDKIHGTYHPVNDFVQCNRSSHGVIDPAWFKDTDGRQYIVYKAENPSGRLEIREVAHSGPKEGVQWIGNAVYLLKPRDQGFWDGQNMEAPYVFKRNGIYFLTYSTHWTNNETYDVQYATSKNIMGPYTRVKEPLVSSGKKFGCELAGPGGASFQRFGNANKLRMVFHALGPERRVQQRPFYTATVHVNGDKLEIKP
ncbi:glycoside hydrolase family 43 protein [Karstenula rhodostoma CBS 690.94]|uniref:Endo-1,5-alpha-L-arabinanase A n=1 Tax=Karstenula rhodostoma CBS 690.94 TaxID=1392251 RepID=A0A9P4P629_9PLEO|nr:glycoside hydrolase family 43 protein [Karstenula rhodostoma CBS 690.94]